MNRKYTGVLPLDHRGVESIANAPVDVLAVMDREIEESRKRVPFMHPEGPQNPQHQREYEETGNVLVQLREARAAVAELIESCGHLKRDATNERWAAFHAALARVKGV